MLFLCFSSYTFPLCLHITVMAPSEPYGMAKLLHIAAILANNMISTVNEKEYLCRNTGPPLNIRADLIAINNNTDC